ncbi:hypothetical protein [Mycobacterium sp. C31M]
MTVDGTQEAHPVCPGSERRAQQVRLWLGAGAMTLGMGAAMLGGAAIAVADPGESTSGSSRDGTSDSSDSPSSNSGSAAGANGRDSADGAVRQRPNVRTAGTSEDDDSDAASESTDTSDDSTGGSDDRTPDDNDTEQTDSETVSPVDEDQHEAETEPEASPSFAENASSANTSSSSTSETSPVIDESPSDNGTSPAAQLISENSSDTETDATQPVTSTASTVGTKTTTAAVSATAVPSAVATAARAPFDLPTPSQLLRGLQELGANLYVTMMNQFYGLQRSLTALRDDVRGILGFTQQVITRALPFGDPTATMQYFATAGNYVTGALATVAMAYGQLTKTVVDLQGFLDAAANTDSIVTLGSKVLGPSTRIVYWPDSYEVLQDKDVRIIMRSYGRDQWSNAFNDLTNGLQDPTKVMIVGIRGLVDGHTSPLVKSVVVLGVDNVNGTVTVNDPTRADGQGLAMSYDDFMGAWADQGYQLVTTQLASSPNVAPADSKSKWVWKLPSAQHVAAGVAAAFVHQVQIFSENITDLGNDLSRTFGVARPEPIDPPSIGDIEYGNYLANYQYWKYQGHFGTCALMSTAAVIAQLTGNGLPVDMDTLAAEVQKLAETLPSGIKVGQSMYTEGLGGTYLSDVVTLLNKFGINADHTTYLKTEGSLALDNMTAALSQKQSVIVTVNNKLIYDAWNKQYFGENWGWYDGVSDKANHAVTVLSVNMTKGVVYINDSAPRQGQGLAVPLDQFMKAWQVASFDLTTAELRGGAAG